MSDKLGEPGDRRRRRNRGLLAARVLAERNEQVILLERDTFPWTANPIHSEKLRIT